MDAKRFANKYLVIEIAANGRVVAFIDRSTGKNYAVREGHPFANISKQGIKYNLNVVTADKDRLILGFERLRGVVILNVEVREEYLKFEVESLNNTEIERLTFVDFRLHLSGTMEDAFAASPLALNLITNVPEMPGYNNRIRAYALRRFGIEGAKLAVIGCPAVHLRRILQKVLSDAPDLPACYCGGPWAMDAEINRGSYLFNYSGRFGYGNRGIRLSADEIVEQAGAVGFAQVDFVAGVRYGDWHIDEELYPAGTAGITAVVDRLHSSGLKAGLHTFSFFMDKGSSFVSPAPHPDIVKDAFFTLSKPVGEQDAFLPVVEPVQNNLFLKNLLDRDFVTLQIEEELVNFRGLGSETQAGFTDCKRGAFGSRPSCHPAGAEIAHLAECFGHFAPAGGSRLFLDIASRLADIVNDCGFDMLYFDALDGGVGVYGEEGRYYEAMFVHEVARRLKRPVSMEMATFHHHLWCLRSRIGAWDLPNRGYKRFVDIHCESNRRDLRMFMPGQLGWWRLNPSGQYTPFEERTYPDDVEYLCCKALANDNALSLTRLSSNARLHEIFRKWEKLRLSGAVTGHTRDVLVRPGEEFTLKDVSSGVPKFQRVEYHVHRIVGDGMNRWVVNNRFAGQSLAIRIELLFCSGAEEKSRSQVLLSTALVESFSERMTASGMQVQLEKGEEETVVFTACNAGKVPRESAWAMAGRQFSPFIDLSGVPVLGFWICGDGKGEVLNMQYVSPPGITERVSEHYLKIDFTGWRYVELLEPEGERFSDYRWPYRRYVDSYLMKIPENPEELETLVATSQHYYRAPYHVYNSSAVYGRISGFNLWYTNIPPGETVSCRLKQVKSMPVKNAVALNPSIVVNSSRIQFPVEMQTGQYLEYSGSSGGTLYDAKDMPVKTFRTEGNAPYLERGNNDIEFFAQAAETEARVRAKVWIRTEGEII